MRELKPKKLYEQAKYHNRLLKKERNETIPCRAVIIIIKPILVQIYI
jgi:hypothetical protein